MPADRQLQVSRRVLPILAGLIPAMAGQFKQTVEMRHKAKAAGEETPPLTDILSMDLSALVPGLQSAAQAIADLPDEQFQYLQNACLQQVQRQRSNDTGWMPIWNPTANTLQFQDLEGHEILLIVMEVLKNEVGPFYLGLVSASIGVSLV